MPFTGSFHGGPGPVFVRYPFPVQWPAFFPLNVQARSLTDTALATDKANPNQLRTRAETALASDMASFGSPIFPILLFGEMALATDYAFGIGPTTGFIQVSLTTPFAQTVWQEIGNYAIEANVTAGKQHALDKMEASTLSVTLDNRGGTGLFTFNPWYFMGQNAVLPIQAPIRVLGTWGGQVYPIFWGLIDSCTPSIPDEVNSECVITATDLMKYLSNDYVASDYYAQQTLALQNVIAYWRLGESVGGRTAYDSSGPTTVSVSGCTVTSGTFTVTTSGNFIASGVYAGMQATGTDVPAGTYVVQVASATSLNLSQLATGSTTTSLTFTKQQYSASLAGAANFGAGGELLYDTDSALDLASATINPSGFLIAPPSLSTAMNTFPGGDAPGQQAWTIELWVAANAPITGGIANAATVFSTYTDANPNSSTHQGYFVLQAFPGQPQFGGTYANLQVITSDRNLAISTKNNQCDVLDGEWHHVVLTAQPQVRNFLVSLYVDGQLVGSGQSTIVGGWWSPFSTGNRLVFGYNPIGSGPDWPGAIDEVAIYSNTMSAGTIESRYDIGRWFYNADYSGDRIAQVLAVVGIPVSFYGGGTPGLHGGTIAKGRVQVATAQDGVSIAGGSPIAITQQTALDYIQTVETTENGAFYQLPSGQIAFRDQYYYYTNSTSTSSQITLADEVDTSYPVHYRPNIELITDDQDIFNIIQVQPANGIQQIARNQQSIKQYGHRVQQGLSGTLQNTQQAALALANLLLVQYQWPLIRVENVQTASYVNAGASMPYQLGLYLFDQFSIIRSAQPGMSSMQGYPQPSGYTSPDPTNPTFDYSTEPGHFLVENIRHTIRVGVVNPSVPTDLVWETIWTGSPYERQGAIFLLELDSMTMGLLDTDALGP